MKIIYRMTILLCVLVLPVWLAGCDNSTPQTQNQSQAGLIGQVAPDISLTDMQGNRVNLSDYRGQVVILNFWATWCPPCREEMPSMEKLHRDYQDKGLVMLAVNVEENGKKAVTSFLKKTPYSFPILLDEQAEAQNSYGVFRYPESFIIDRNGIVVERIIGARDWLSGPTFKVINFLING